MRRTLEIIGRFDMDEGEPWPPKGFPKPSSILTKKVAKELANQGNTWGDMFTGSMGQARVKLRSALFLYIEKKTGRGMTDVSEYVKGFSDDDMDKFVVMVRKARSK